jgi:pilus assembly protein Flp/PilA
MIHLHYQFFTTWLSTKSRSERAASLVEYALLVALIAVVCVAAVSFLGTNTKGQLSKVGSSLK